ncbi:MAG: S26 family signal peptidase [Candidatus Omnitrophota bacterium]|nr:S26 family signal peptidase [Candidatus Omnitrophota bacterium]
MDLAGLLQSVFAKGASFRFQVNGFSMSPLIKDKDVVTVSPIHNSTIGFGQSAAFINPCSGKFVIHRVIGKKGNSYFIKGDNITEAAGLIPRKNILGVVTAIERNGKLIKLGLGFERFLIGFLSKLKLLPFCFWCCKQVLFSARRLIKSKILL